MMPLAQRLDPLEEFLSEPGLTVACVLLVVVSVAWIVGARLIARKLRRAERRAATLPKGDKQKPSDYQKPRNIWGEPPA